MVKNLCAFFRKASNQELYNLFGTEDIFKIFDKFSEEEVYKIVSDYMYDIWVAAKDYKY